MTRIPLRNTVAGEAFLNAPAKPQWSHVFSQTGPLELEIGCGAGGFALGYCARFPNARYIAFEWRKKYAREVAHRASLKQLTNLLVIEGDARLEMPKLFEPNSLDAIHLQFPDPWWKRAHFKRAILLPDLTAYLLTLLKPGGRFDFRTDVAERATAGLAVLEAAGFQNPLGAGQFHPFDPEEVPSTRERRYLVTGEPVYRARLFKPSLAF
jgi:tRNA (guanine-N7-)-methyltransferase